MPCLKRYESIAVVTALCIALGAAYTFGSHTATVVAERDAAVKLAEQAKADADELARQIKQTQDNERSAAKQQAERDLANKKTDIEYRTITQTVTKYVQAHPDNDLCSLDADGLQIWRAANAGTAVPADTHKP